MGVVAFDIDVGVSLDSALASSVMFVLPVSAGSTASANAAEDDISLCCSAAGSVAVGALFLGSFSARAVAAPTSAVALTEAVELSFSSTTAEVSKSGVSAAGSDLYAGISMLRGGALRSRFG